ncbi:hypothetical protein HOK021_68060 [Streptomyces hygroscopicus]|nr:hypothetical protein HOK021_68060 [Streptomyces hygroscopicus]
MGGTALPGLTNGPGQDEELARPPPVRHILPGIATPTPPPLESVPMTFHSGARAFELLARSHHHSSHYGGHYDSHTTGVSFAGAWWMIPVGVVLGVAWVFVKRRLRSR